MVSKWERVEALIKVQVVKEMERMSGVKIEIERLWCNPIRGEMGCRRLTVYGSPGEWSRDAFARVEEMSCKTSGFIGTLSLAGMQSLSFGTHIPFVFGFKGKMIDEMKCSNVALPRLPLAPPRPRGRGGRRPPRDASRGFCRARATGPSGTPRARRRSRSGSSPTRRRGGATWTL